MRYDVALAACKSYEDAEVSAALESFPPCAKPFSPPAGWTGSRPGCAWR